MPENIEGYLAELRTALAGADPALTQDAVYDAEEYLRSAAGQADAAAGVAAPPALRAAAVSPAASANVPAAMPVHMPAESPPDAWIAECAAPMLAALGGRANVRVLVAVAGTRLRAELADGARFDANAARIAGALGVMAAAPGIVHLIVGDQAPQFARAIARL